MEWAASVHILHMPRHVITFVFIHLPTFNMQIDQMQVDTPHIEHLGRYLPWSHLSQPPIRSVSEISSWSPCRLDSLTSRYFTSRAKLDVVPTHLKTISQIGSSPQVGVENDNNEKYLKPPPGEWLFVRWLLSRFVLKSMATQLNNLIKMFSKIWKTALNIMQPLIDPRIGEKTGSPKIAAPLYEHMW